VYLLYQVCNHVMYIGNKVHICSLLDNGLKSSFSNTVTERDCCASCSICGCNSYLH
jgi:hypothetical protein